MEKEVKLIKVKSFLNEKKIPYLAFIIIFSVIFFIFYDIITLQKVYFGGDITYQNLPQSVWAFKQIKKGIMPWWCPLLANGFPVFAEGQTGIMYPFNILFLYFPTYVVFHYLIIFHFILASFFMYLYLREIKVSLLASLLASLGLILIYAKDFYAVNFFYTVSYLPLLFYLTEKTFKSKKKTYILIALALTMAMQNFTTHLQVSFINLFALFLYVFGKSITAKLKKETIFIITTTFFVLLIISVLISLVQILPQQELVKLSIRAEKLPYSQVTKNSLNPQEILKIFPDKKLSLEGSRLTLLFFLFFLISSFFTKKDKKYFLYLGILIINLLLSFDTPFYRLFYDYMPVFNNLTPASKFRISANFFLLVLFTSSFDKGLNFINKNKYHLTIVLVIFVILFSFDTQNFKITFFPPNYIKITTLYFKEFSRGIILKTSPKIYKETPEFIKYLKKDKDYYSVIGLGGFLNPNINLFFEVPLIVNYSPLRLKRRQILLNKPIKRIEDLMNRKYVVLPKNFPQKAIKDKNLKLVYDKEVKIYKDLDVFKKVFFVAYFQVYNNSFELLKEAQYGETNLKKIVLLEEIPKIKKEIKNKNFVKKEKIKIIKYQPNKILIKANLTKAGFLVLTDTYYPGWKVFVDKKQRKIYCANYNFRAVFVEAGKHTIKFIYKPFSFYLGFIISCLSLLVLIFVLVIIKFLKVLTF